jgi:hypothetical protein
MLASPPNSAKGIDGGRFKACSPVSMKYPVPLFRRVTCHHQLGRRQLKPPVLTFSNTRQTASKNPRLLPDTPETALCIMKDLTPSSAFNYRVNNIRTLPTLSASRTDRSRNDRLQTAPRRLTPCPSPTRRRPQPPALQTEAFATSIMQQQF